MYLKYQLKAISSAYLETRVSLGFRQDKIERRMRQECIGTKCDKNTT